MKQVHVERIERPALNISVPEKIKMRYMLLKGIMQFLT